MRKSLDLDEEGCYLQAGHRGCLEECGFNATTKTIFIIHGWTVAECFCIHVAPPNPNPDHHLLFNWFQLWLCFSGR